MMAIVPYILPDTSFTFLPIHICCTASHGVRFGFYFLVNFSLIGTCLAGVAVDEFLSIEPAISPCIQF